MVGMSPSSVGSLPSADEVEDEAEERDQRREEELRLLYQEFLLEPGVLTKDWLQER